MAAIEDWAEPVPNNATASVGADPWMQLRGGGWKGRTDILPAKAEDGPRTAQDPVEDTTALPRTPPEAPEAPVEEPKQNQSHLSRGSKREYEAQPPFSCWPHRPQQQSKQQEWWGTEEGWGETSQSSDSRWYGCTEHGKHWWDQGTDRDTWAWQGQDWEN